MRELSPTVEDRQQVGTAAAPPVPLAVTSADEQRQRAVRRNQLARASQALPAAEQGYFLDILYARLLQILGNSGSIERNEAAIRVVLPTTSTFDAGSAVLSPAAEALLTALLPPLADYPALLISVHGHADTSGSDDANQRLSALRAQAMARRLLDSGIPAQHVLAVGHGASQPIAGNDTAEGREANRRVELLLEPVVANELRR